MPKYKVLLAHKSQKIPQDIQALIDKGQAERVIAPPGTAWVSDGRAKLVTIINHRLMIGEV